MFRVSCPGDTVYQLQSVFRELSTVGGDHGGTVNDQD